LKLSGGAAHSRCWPQGRGPEPSFSAVLFSSCCSNGSRENRSNTVAQLKPTEVRVELRSASVVAHCGGKIYDSDLAVLRKLLAHMQAAERGLKRLEAAVGRTGPEALARILESLKLNSMERVDNLETLKEIVLKLEQCRNVK
jgi:hypothetical protein